MFFYHIFRNFKQKTGKLLENRLTKSQIPPVTLETEGGFIPNHYFIPANKKINIGRHLVWWLGSSDEETTARTTSETTRQDVFSKSTDPPVSQTAAMASQLTNMTVITQTTMAIYSHEDDTNTHNPSLSQTKKTHIWSTKPARNTNLPKTTNFPKTTNDKKSAKPKKPTTVKPKEISTTEVHPGKLTLVIIIDNKHLS